MVESHDHKCPTCRKIRSHNSSNCKKDKNAECFRCFGKWHEKCVKANEKKNRRMGS